MSLFELMNKAAAAPAAVTTPKLKRTIREVDGEWRDSANPDIVYCLPPVEGKTCPKCVGSTRIVFFSTEEVHRCWWCTDGRGTISRNDMSNYRRRLRLKLEMCYIRTYIAPVRPLILSL